MAQRKQKIVEARQSSKLMLPTPTEWNELWKSGCLHLRKGLHTQSPPQLGTKTHWKRDLVKHRRTMPTRSIFSSNALGKDDCPRGCTVPLGAGHRRWSSYPWRRFLENEELASMGWQSGEILCILQWEKHSVTYWWTGLLGILRIQRKERKLHTISVRSKKHFAFSSEIDASTASNWRHPQKGGINWNV